MDLRLSAEQEQLVDAFRSLFAKRSSAEQVREAEPAGFDRDLWAKLVEMGVVEMAVDVDHGGWGASPSTWPSSPSSTASTSLPLR